MKSYEAGGVIPCYEGYAGFRVSVARKWLEVYTSTDIADTALSLSPHVDVADEEL